MLSIYKLLFTTFFLLFIAFATNAQVCTGSLGDPVINEDFGAGTPQPLPTGVTTMQYSPYGCVQDGQYNIASNDLNTSNQPCYGNWQRVTQDHTGNPNGNMMIVNASLAPDVFYVQQAPTLCPGTTYEFAAYVMNLLTNQGNGYSQPDITFSVETVSGTVLKTYSTGSIPISVTPTWIKCGMLFTTPANGDPIVVRMKNNAPGGNGNDFLLDDITFRPCGPVLQAGFGAATGPAAQPLCSGSNANYTLQAANLSGSGTLAYQWQENKNNTGWVDMPGQTSNTLNLLFANAVAGTYQYRFGASEIQNVASPGCRTYSNPVEVDVNPLPVATIVAPATVCEGNVIQLQASGGTTYQWSGPNGFTSNQSTVVINNSVPANSGNYTVTVTSDLNCTASATTAVTVYPKVTATISSDATICQGQSATLSAGGGTTYAWLPVTGLSDPTSANPIASPDDTTTYTVKVSNANGCFDTKTVTINVLKKPVADAGPKLAIFEGQSVKINAKTKGDISTVYWTPADYLDNPNSLTPVASPVNDITYTLHIQSANGCGTDTSSVFVRVYKEITIPNTFSPNNDGVNDLWNIDALITYPDCLVTVFNRYGQQVYKSTGYSKPWNGNYNGAPLPVGTYYYVIDLKIGKPKLSGWVLIVR